MLRAITLSALVMLSGCSTYTNQLGFEDVRNAVQSQTGHQLAWHTSDEQVSPVVAQLLAAELSAEQAVQIALLNNRALQATYQNLGIAQADLVQAGLFPNPILSGEILLANGAPSIELSLVHSIIKALEVPMRKKIAQSEFEEVKLQVVEEVLLLAYRVRRAFYEYQASKQLRELTTTAAAAMEASQELAQRLHTAGNITDLALAQERANYQQIKIELSMLREENAERRERLNLLMGLASEQSYWKSAHRLPEINATAVQLSELESTALANSIVLAKARQRLNTLTASLDVAATFRNFGDTELDATTERESEGSWRVGPGISFPLPLFDQGQSGVYKVRAQIAQQHNALADLTTKIQSKVRTLTRRTKYLQSLLHRYRRGLMPLQATVVTETQKQYNAMLVGTFHLLAVKQAQISTAKGYVQALKEYWLLQTEIKAAIEGVVPEYVQGEESFL